MDFIDYDAFSSQGNNQNESYDLPEPAPPLVLPLNTNTLTNKLKSLSLLGKDNNDQNLDSSSISIKNSDNKGADLKNINKSAEKYAKLTLDLLKNSTDGSVLISDLSDQPGNDKNKTNNNQVLSNKLAQVLNTYESNDPSLREALNILQSRPDLDLNSLIRSDLYGLISRRSFRTEVENDLLKQHTTILRNFEPIVSKIESLDYKINELNDVNKKLNDVKGLNPEFLKKVDDLVKKKQLITLQKNILLNFKKKFTLSQYEEHFLTNEPISLEFFEILNKVKKIHSNCSILLSLNNQNLGFKIMDKMNYILELSYQRISFFLSNELNNFMKKSEQDSTSNYQSSNLKLIKISFHYLSSHLKSFNEITSKLVQSRSKVINDEFTFQVNSSDVSNNFDHSRPIALSAHDPVRYTGDILAYVHSIIVNEIEFIKGLFQPTNDMFDSDVSEFEKSLQELENSISLESSLEEIISKVISSLKKPLKLKIEQVLRTETDLDIIYQIFNLLELYEMMYQKQLSNDDSGILETLEFLQKLSSERVFSILDDKIKRITKENETKNWELDDDSLLSPDWLNINLGESLVIFNFDDYSKKELFNLNETELKSLTDLIVMKPVELLKSQAEKNFKKQPNSKYSFLLNSYDLIESKILPISKLTNQAQQISALISETKERLITSEYETLLSQSGLNIHQQLIQLIFPIEQIESEDDYYMYSSLVENKLFNLDNLRDIEVKLHEYLPVAIIEIQQSLFKISSASIVDDVLNQISLKFLKLYNVFYKILKIVYEEESILEWSTFEVATLLGVESLYKEIGV